MKKLNKMKDCINTIMELEDIDMLRAFKILLQWSAYNAEVMDVCIKCRIITYNYLKENISKEFLIEDNRDLLGELYCMLKLNGKKSNLIPYDKAQVLAETIRVEFNNKSIKTFCDNRVGTGRTLIKIHEYMGNNALLYGIEKDKTLYRICITNMALYNIPSRIVYMDNDKITCGMNDEVWDKASSWNQPSFK